MPPRHRRTGRRPHPDRAPRAAHPPPAAAQREERLRLAFDAEQRKLLDWRTRVALLVVIPLAASLLCGSQIPVPFACDVPREAWLAVLAAIFGGYLGLWLRMVLERRRFEREVRPSTS